MIVYMDLIFLVNFLLDGAILVGTARTRKLPGVWWRLLFAAGIGACYVLLLFVPALSFLFTFLMKGAISLLMLWIAFGFISLEQYMRNAGTFYLISFAAAGGIYGIHYFLQSAPEFWNGIWFNRTGGIRVYSEMGLLFVLTVFGGLLLLFKTVFNSAKRKEEISVHLAQVEVRIGESVMVCTGLVDTGNQLYDPLTRTPVMVMEAGEWGDQLPSGWLKLIQTLEVEQIVSAMGEQDFAWQDRLRLVPYRGVNRSTQFMLAIKPDKVVITYNENVWESKKVLVGLDGGSLCNDGSYQAIIHPALVAAS